MKLAAISRHYRRVTLPAADTPPAEPPWMAGLRAARANLIPGLIVQGAILAVVLAYYFHPRTTVWLDALARLKAEWGFIYSVAASIVAGAFLPELLRVLVFQKGAVLPANGRNLLFTIPFWSFMAIMVDLLYQLQSFWFGDEPSLAVVLKKVAFDQLVFGPFLSSPLTVWYYDFKNRGRHAVPPSRFFTFAHYRESVVPVMMAAWAVWIPLVSILYSLPQLLQIPVYTLALTLWVMLYTWMSEHRPERRSS